MRIDILTLFPDMFRGAFENSILKRAVAKHLLELHTHDIRAYTTDKHHKTYVTEDISIGDYVLSGGELAAMVVTDAVARVIPGVIGDGTSALSDSFQDGLLSPPVYTRPADFRGHRVPDVLLSGNEKLIKEWKFEQQMIRTKERRPDLLQDL